MDESLFQGTCYKACGFEAIGASSGFGRASRDFYIEHGKPKQLFLRALPDTRRGHGLDHRKGSVRDMVAVGSTMGASGLQDFESISSKFTPRQLGALHVWPDKDGVRRPPSDTTFGRALAACDVHALVVIILETAVEGDFKTRKGPSHPGGWAYG